MTTRNLVILMICASSIAICADNNAAVRGPVTGYIFDAQAHAIRPMMGIPNRGAHLGAVSRPRDEALPGQGPPAFRGFGGGGRAGQQPPENCRTVRDRKPALQSKAA